MFCFRIWFSGWCSFAFYSCIDIGFEVYCCCYFLLLVLTVYLKLKIALYLLYSNATSFEMLFIVRDCATIGTLLADFEGGKVDAVLFTFHITWHDEPRRLWTCYSEHCGPLWILWTMMNLHIFMLHSFPRDWYCGGHTYYLNTYWYLIQRLDDENKWCFLHDFLHTLSESECFIKCVNFKCRNVWTVLEIILKYWWCISKRGGVFGGKCKILEVLGFLLVCTYVKAYLIAKQCVNIKCVNMKEIDYEMHY